MASVSSLPSVALQASQAALNSALADVEKEKKAHENGTEPSTEGDDNETKDDNDEFEDGEIQEVDMESQAEGIRTVFSDPKNFNVKVRTCCLLYPLEAFGFCRSGAKYSASWTCLCPCTLCTMYLTLLSSASAVFRMDSLV